MQPCGMPDVSSTEPPVLPTSKFRWQSASSIPSKFPRSVSAIGFGVTKFLVDTFVGVSNPHGISPNTCRIQNTLSMENPLLLSNSASAATASDPFQAHFGGFAAASAAGGKGDRAADGGATNLDQLRQRSRPLQFPSRLSMYARPPPTELSLEDFEQFALDRLQGTRVWIMPRSVESRLIFSRTSFQSYFHFYNTFIYMLL